MHQIRGAMSPKSGINWVIVGGESGPNARPMHPAWARSLRDQCQAAGVPFFFKQWGEWVDPDEIDTAGWDDVLMNERAAYVTPPGKVYNHTSLGVTLDAIPMWKVGKKTAGARLDGRECKEYPQ